MAQTIPMEENGILCGSVDHRTEGCYVVFSVDVPQWGCGMKKVWLTADSGGRMLLGTLQPEQHRLRLCRKISQSALRCCGLEPPTKAVVNPGEGETAPRRKNVPEGWQSMDSLPLRDERSRGLLQREKGGMWQRQGERVVVRYPWRRGDPIPALPLFRYGSPTEGWWELRFPAER